MNQKAHSPMNMLNKEIINNSSNIKLDKLTLSDAVGSEVNKEVSIEVHEIKDENPVKLDSDYDKYFSGFVEELQGISKEEKSELSGFIKEAMTRSEDFFSSGWSSSKESMYHLQTQEKLNLLAEKVIPASQSEALKDLAKQFTDDQLEQTVEKSLQTYEIIYNRDKDKSGPLGEIASRLNSAIHSIREGSHITQVEQKQYEGLFAELQSSSIFQGKYEEVMNGYKEIQKEQLGGAWNNRAEKKVSESIKLLREDWNDFINNVGQLNDYKVSTVNESRVDIKI